MKIKHIDPMGGGRIAALGMQTVQRDEVVDVPEDVAPLLLIQTENWEPADKAAEKLAATVIADNLAELESASIAAAVVPSAVAPDAEIPTPDLTETSGEGDPA